MIIHIELENRNKVKRFIREIFNCPRPGIFLAGGAARSLITNEEVVDYDLFFASAEIAEKFEKDLLMCSKAQVKYRCPAGELVTIMWDNKYKIQLIKKTYHPTPENLVERFDFTICKFAVDMADFSIHYAEADAYDAHNRILRVNNIQYPVATLHRVKKYLDKGYRPSDWQWFWEDIIKRTSKIELTDENLALYID